jgi:hypothetical protein
MMYARDLEALNKSRETRNWYFGTGKIVYDPPRGNMTKKIDWWVVLELDSSITDYYRHWVNKHINPLGYTLDDQTRPSWPELRDKREDLMLPSWGAHMSIVRGEKPKPQLQHLWKLYDGWEVDFQYSYFPRFSGDTKGGNPAKDGVYWFVDAVCPIGKQIRDDFELPSHWNFHITVGRVNTQKTHIYRPPQRSIFL